MHAKAISLLFFSIFTAHATLAHADETCEGVQPKTLAVLGERDGEEVLLVAVSCQGLGDHVEREAWIQIGDEVVPEPFESSDSIGTSMWSIGSVRRQKGSASFELSEDQTPYYNYYGPDLTSYQRWSFDFTTRKSTRVKKRLDDPRDAVISRLIRQARRGDIEGALNDISEAFIFTGWELDTTRVMTRLLKGMDYSAKRAHSRGDTKRAAEMAASALAGIWTGGLNVSDGTFSYTVEDGAGSGDVNVSRKTSPAWLYTNLGFYLTEGGQHARAITLLEAVVVVFPDHAPAWINLGDAHAAMGDPASARASYERYVAVRRASGRKVPSRITRALKATP